MAGEWTPRKFSTNSRVITRMPDVSEAPSPKVKQTHEVRKLSLKNNNNKVAPNDTTPKIMAPTPPSRWRNRLTNNVYIDKIKETWGDDQSSLRLSMPIFVIIVFSIISAAAFYGIENNQCQGATIDYVRSLYFVNTIFTTIGYGNIVPCTAVGKVASVVLAILGIPLNIIVLTNVGKLLTRLIYWVYCGMVSVYKCIVKHLKRLKSKNSNDDAIEIKKENEESEKGKEQDEDDYDDFDMEFEDPPLALALLVTVGWFLLSAVFFHFTESDNIGFGDAFYFVMMSVTTVGFGDIAPEKYRFVVFQFFFIYIGIAFFSMLINILEDNLERLSRKVEQLIRKEFKQAQQQGTKLNITSEREARERIARIIKQQRGGTLLRAVMSKNMENRLVDEYIEKASQDSTSTQTDTEYKDAAIEALPAMVDAETETEKRLTETIKESPPSPPPKPEPEEPKADPQRGRRNLSTTLPAWRI